MPKYVIAYLGGKQMPNPQDRAAHMARWKAWVDGLGSAMVNPGTPLGQGKLVNSDGVSERGPNALTGFSIVTTAPETSAPDWSVTLPMMEPLLNAD